MRISKSAYLAFITCPKQFWLNKHHPELAQVDVNSNMRFEQGNEIGELALKLFDGVKSAVVQNTDGSLDIGEMCQNTQRLIDANCSAIAEAAFSNDTNYCAVDILKNNFDGTWDIFEVKSSTSRKLIYLYDIAFQHFVLTQANIKVRKCHLIYVNKDYTRVNGLDVNELFIAEEVTGLLPEFEKDIEVNIQRAQELHAQGEPLLDININCNDEYPCAFYNYCSRHLPRNNVFDLYGVGFNKKAKFECYNNGVISFEDVRNNHVALKEKQQRQLDYTLDNLPPYVDKPEIKEFLGQMKFPIYFLDFETYQYAAPPYVGIKVNQQVPFQYSLHILKKNGGELEHKEFLADENKNEWRKLAEQLVKDIPTNGGTVISYNSNFENSRISEMAEAFPDLREALNDMIARMKDLLDVFHGGYYYCKEMGGSFSIKSVLPALCPNDPSLDYKTLNDVQNGTEAVVAFAALKTLPADKRKALRENLLKYCCLDSYAMVMIYNELLAKTK